jgi:hypothetical protein
VFIVAIRYHFVVQKTPDWYADWRAAFDIDIVEYGGIGIQLFRPNEIPEGQLGFAITSDGRSLMGSGQGDWRPEWVVIGCDTGCGDPIFASDVAPHPVFSAMHGQGYWQAKLVAASLDAFAHCFRAFQRFAAGRSIPDEVDANPPTPEEQAQFLTVIRSLTDGDNDALGFWAVQIDLDLDSFTWPA